ncbi:MAG: PstS family phosphate ABC transporter substrate-binding protein [Chloroflexota bacterium]|nr:PstS family phosphate ABC transporter substrate-binding protein [Chloroflexota bacterium]
MTLGSYRFRGVAFWAVALALFAALAAPTALTSRAQDGSPTADLGNLEGTVASDGSSTVGPITQAVAEEFNAEAENVDVTVDISGTGGGFERFCAGETDIQNASRPIEEDEMAACSENGVDYYQFQVALDGITVVVNPELEIECMTSDQLRQLWAPDSTIANFNELDPSFPDQEISLYGPGTDSGTFDFFTDAIVGEEGASRTDYTPSEDDNVIVEGVAGDEGGLGYFGYAYFEENQDRLAAVAVDNGDGCVEATPETIADGAYAPLSRPLFIYMRAESMERPEVQAFARFYIENAGELVQDVGFVPAPDEVYTEDAEKVEAAIAGGAEPDGPEGEGEATPEV